MIIEHETQKIMERLCFCRGELELLSMNPTVESLYLLECLEKSKWECWRTSPMDLKQDIYEVAMERVYA